MSFSSSDSSRRFVVKVYNDLMVKFDLYRQVCLIVTHPRKTLTLELCLHSSLTSAICGSAWQNQKVPQKRKIKIALIWPQSDGNVNLRPHNYSPRYGSEYTLHYDFRFISNGLCFSFGDMQSDTQRNLNIIRCQFKMIFENLHKEIADEVEDSDELDDKEMQKRIDQYVQKNITGNNTFWSRKISKINSDFKQLYDKLRDSFSASCWLHSLNLDFVQQKGRQLSSALRKYWHRGVGGYWHWVIGYAIVYFPSLPLYHVLPCHSSTSTQLFSTISFWRSLEKLGFSLSVFDQRSNSW